MPFSLFSLIRFFLSRFSGPIRFVVASITCEVSFTSFDWIKFFTEL